MDSKTIIIIIAGAILLALVLYVIIRLKTAKNTPRYLLKDSLVTRSEKAYLDVFNAYFGDQYLIIPQVNLASVIDKEGSGYRSELFRNVDFGVFDFNFRPILLIEINDRTHLRKDRRARDEKVNSICKKARIPLVTFWTRDGIDNNDIYKTLKKYL